MNRLRVAIAAIAFISCCAPLVEARPCTPQDPTGYFEGSAISQQAGKVDVSLNLHCDSGRYTGELVTTVGTYAVKEGTFEAGKLRLTLVAGSDTVTIEAAFEDRAVRGNFVSGEDKGPLELHRTGDAKTSSCGETLNLTKAQWHEDLAFFARELPKRHANAFHSISREKFEAEVSELDHRLDQLNGDEIYVGIDRIANLIGDGHTYARLPEDYANLPIDIARFGDDYRVVATANGNEKALGARVIKIEDTSTARAHEMLLALPPSDETGVLRNARANGFLTIGILLHGMGIVPDRNLVRYAFSDDDGKNFTVDVHSVARSDRLNWKYPYKEAPLFQQKADEDFWYTYLSGFNAVYCSFRGYKDLGQHSKGLFDLIKQKHPDKLVIDMRMNGGGDYNVGLRHMVHPIRYLADINRKGHLFVLIGSDSFSAAMSNSAHFRYQTNAILVGQQIGEKPNSYQEAREMKLPNSHWTVRYSIKFYKFVDNGENLIRPDQEIIPSWDDYKSARDPVLDWVLNYKP
jgi:Peptidase family S41